MLLTATQRCQPGLLSFKKQYAVCSSRSTQEKCSFCLSLIQGISTPHCPLSMPGLCLLLPRSTSPLGLLQQMAQTSENSELQLHCLQKLTIVNSSLFPRQWLWRSAFLTRTQGSSFPLRLSTLHVEGSNPSVAPWLFPPPGPYSAPHTCYVLSLKLCRLFS